MTQNLPPTNASDEMVEIELDLTDELIAKLNASAAERGISVNALVIEILSESLSSGQMLSLAAKKGAGLKNAGALASAAVSDAIQP